MLVFVNRKSEKNIIVLNETEVLNLCEKILFSLDDKLPDIFFFNLDF